VAECPALGKKESLLTKVVMWLILSAAATSGFALSRSHMITEKAKPARTPVVNKEGGWINQIKKASCQSNHSVPEAVMRAAETRRNYREESPRIAVGVG